MPDEQIISGALFDFLGYLTILEEPMTFGAACEAAPAVQILEAFAGKRGLSLDDPKIKSWREPSIPDGAIE